MGVCGFLIGMYCLLATNPHLAPTIVPVGAFVVSSAGIVIGLRLI